MNIIMVIRSSVLIICLVLQNSVARLIFTSVLSHANKQYADVNLTVVESEGESLLNFSLITKAEIIKMMGTFSFCLPKDDKDDEFQNQVVQSTINMCKLSAGVRGNFLTKMLMEEFDKSADFKIACPMPAKRYNLRNLKITDAHIPSYLMIRDMKFMIQLRAQAKIQNVKLLTYLYHLKFFGTLGRN